MDGAEYYAYRIDGPLPTGRFEWHAFDRDKILLDPYARSVFFPPSFNRISASQPGSNAGRAPSSRPYCAAFGTASGASQDASRRSPAAAKPKAIGRQARRPRRAAIRHAHYGFFASNRGSPGRLALPKCRIEGLG